jgi:hypothetical protein
MRSPVIRKVIAGLLLPPVFVLSLIGCGSTTPLRDPAQEARVVAEINALCRQWQALPVASRRSKQQIRATQEGLGALQRVLGKTAAYLPAGKDLNEAHAARHALLAEQNRHSTGEWSGPNTRFEKVQLRIYHDEIALGVTCGGQVALAAHQMEHEFAVAVSESEHAAKR